MAVETDRGFHNPGVIGPFASAAAVGKLLGLDETSMAWALGIAGSHSAGLIEFVWEGAMTKRLHEGRAAANGLESALLAQMGFTGPTTVLEGQYGYLNAVSPNPHPERLTEKLGTVWLGDHRPFKPYACHSISMALVHAIQVFKQTNAIDSSSIQRILLLAPATHGDLAHGEAEDRHQDTEPDSIMGAQYSIPFMVAIALCRDMVNDPIMTEETVKDPVIRRLAKRVETKAERQSKAGDKSIEVRLEMADGKQHVFLATTFPGSPETPLDYQGVAEKFRRFTSRLLTEKQANEIVNLIADVDKVGDMAQLGALMRSEPPR
jgi:2-methylcitrate dehydratase PrpD